MKKAYDYRSKDCPMVIINIGDMHLEVDQRTLEARPNRYFWAVIKRTIKEDSKNAKQKVRA